MQILVLFCHFAHAKPLRKICGGVAFSLWIAKSPIILKTKILRPSRLLVGIFSQ